jgi:xeroderma pigmentosum group C-complementing protein
VPTSWAEFFHPKEEKWIPLDCVRGMINCRNSLEQPHSSKRQHIFIIGVEDNKILNVTRRYCSQYCNVTAKLRRPEEQVFQETLRILCPFECLSLKEEKELKSFADSEPMPDSAAGFKMHDKYILASGLKKYEVFWPPDMVVGEFRGEAIHLREHVQKVRSKEAWFTQFARIIKVIPLV